MTQGGALALALSIVAGDFASPRAAVTSRMPAPRVAAVRPSAVQRAADRVTERRIRRAIRSDPFLALAAARVKVTSRDGIVRLVGRVASAKEHSSIAFKAGQNVLGGRVDDRIFVGDGPAPTAW